MKSIIFEFDAVIYPFKLLVTKNFDPKELSDKFYVVNDHDELEDAPDSFIPSRRTIARTLQVADKKECRTSMLIMLCHSKLIAQGTVSHESFHVVNIISECLGFFPKNAMEDEPGAYLIQWVSNCIDSVLRGHPEKMNGIKLKTNEQD